MQPIEPAGRWLWEVLRQLGIEREFRAHRALSAWETIVGESIARVAQPLRIEGGTLWVAVKSNAWAQELQFQKAILLQRLNEKAGNDCFKEIRFVVRSQLRHPSSGSPSQREHRFLPQDLELTSEEREALQQSVATIEEPALREAIYRAREASLRYEKWRIQSGWRRCEQCGEWHAESSRRCFLCREQGRAGR
ncbi:hypothetical protein HRbin15_00606 [bacterium HR15]|nr:hypothetical protein HRbin15_00606 [bacterium HR15]